MSCEASVIIAAHQRRADLLRLFEGLATQSLGTDAFEVIVIDDGSSDGTRQMLAAAQERSPFPLKVGAQDRGGPGAARNRGAALASAELLVFVDSDCAVGATWLERLLHPFEDPSVILVGGPEALYEGEPLIARAAFHTTNSWWLTGGIRGRGQRAIARYLPRSFNMAIRTERFVDVGGFKQSRIYGEDIELSHRVLERGGRAMFASDAAVMHKKPSTLTRVAQQAYRIGRARWDLFRRYPATREVAFVLPSAWLTSVLALALCTAAFPPLSLLFAAAWSPFLLAAVAAVFHARDLRLLPLVVGVGATQMACYGSGFLAGAVLPGRRPRGSGGPG